MKITSLFIVTAFLIAEGQVHGQVFDKLVGADLSVVRRQLLEDLRGQLSAKGADIGSSPNIQSLTGDNVRDGLTSSFFFKELLSDASATMLRQVKYGTPLAISPNMTLQELDKQLIKKDIEVTISALNRKGYDKQAVSDLDQLLTRIRTLTKWDETLQKLAPAAVSASEASAISVIREHVRRGPRNAQGKTIEQILGPVQDLDLFSNRVRNVFFVEGLAKDTSSDTIGYDKKIALSLSMLVSIRTQQDEAFLRLQASLIEYLTQQKEAFALRLGSIQTGDAKPSAEWFKELKIGSSTPSIYSLDNVPSSQFEAYRLSYFFEGHAPFVSFDGENGEREFLAHRLGKIEAVLPFLKKRLYGAAKAHDALSQLSTQQIDYLIDMFLQLNRDDLPVPSKMETLKFAILDNQQDVSLLNNLNYYRQVSRDLESLKAFLREESLRAKSKLEDLQIIRSRTP